MAEENAALMAEAVPVCFMLALVGTVIAWIVLHGVLLGELKRRHAEKFPPRGNKPIFQQGAMMQFFFVCEFLLKSGYARLGDARVTALSLVLKVLPIVAVLCFIGTALSPMFMEGGAH